MIPFTGYVGPRIEEGCALEWPWIDFGEVGSLDPRAIVDLDWYSLRHFCGWHFYVNLGFSDELTAYQHGHADAKLVRELYGHGRADALERLKRGARVEVRPIRATSLPHAVGEPA
jgi:hypothetical protein